ncbi:MAG: HlyD family efflux transporter periplasmic adaptor subunit, partial [Pseudomonadota bacterium]|nr:HlyD family efflux transporter periplasmic adaptor subunit [Pseudomonadota bacterium]
ARAMASALRQAEQSRDVAARTRAIRVAQVADGRLTSPLSGLVVARDVEAGQLVTPGTPAFTIVATDVMRVTAWVDETALGRLAVGQPARLVFRSEGERSFPGTVTRIGREVDRQTHELLVDVAVLELPTNFAVGQRADAWIEVGRRDAVTSVPRGWCTDECVVADDGRVAARAVTFGLVGRESVEVLTGLAPGDIVLAPGAPVGKRVRVVGAP